MSISSVLMSVSSMSHVDFRKWPCRPVECKGQWSLRAQSKGQSMTITYRTATATDLLFPTL